MRTITNLFGLSFLTSLFLVLPACGDDDPPMDTDGSGTHTGPTGTGTLPTTTTTGPTSTTATTVDPSTTTMGDSTTSGETTDSTTTDPTTETSTDPTETTTDPTQTTSETDTNSDTGTETDTSSTTESTGTGLEELIQSMCQWGANCCDNGEFDYIFGPYTTNVADCTDRITQELNSNDNTSPTKTGKVDSLLSNLGWEIRLDRSTPIEANITACIAEWNKKECNKVLDEDNCEVPEEDPCELRKLFTGKLGAGEACNKDLTGIKKDIECMYGTTCEDTVGNGDAADYKCVDKGVMGEACEPESTNDEGSCEYDLYCDAGTGRCVQRPGLGQTCAYITQNDPGPDAGNESIPCMDDYTCDPATNKCVDECAIGDRCSQGANEDANETQDLTCPAGSACVPYYDNPSGETHYFCRAPSTSGRCNSHDDCASSHFCNNVTGGAATGTCTARIIEGNTCNNEITGASGGNDDRACQDGLFCDDEGIGATNECTKWLNNGDACDNHGDCNPNTAPEGCFDKGAGKQCQDKEIEAVGDFCAVADGADHDDLEFWTKLETKVGSAVEGFGDLSHFANFCKTGFCDGNTCEYTAAAGGQCDNDFDDTDKDNCGVGYQCVMGTCQKWSAAGTTCDRNKQGSDEVLNCDPDTEKDGSNTGCHDVHSGFYCGLVTPSTRRTYCDGAGDNSF